MSALFHPFLCRHIAAEWVIYLRKNAIIICIPIICVLISYILCSCNYTDTNKNNDINSDLSATEIDTNHAATLQSSDILLPDAVNSEKKYKLDEIMIDDIELVFELSAKDNSIGIVGTHTVTKNGEYTNAPILLSLSPELTCQNIEWDLFEDVLAWGIAATGDGSFYCLVQDIYNERKCVLQKFDSLGHGVQSIEIDNYIKDSSSFVGMCVDGTGNLVFATTDIFVVFDESGNVRSTLTVDGSITDVFINNEGIVIVCVNTEDALLLYELESDPWKLVSWLKLSNDFDDFSFLGCEDSHCFFLYNYKELYRYNYETNALTVEFLFSDIGISTSNISAITYSSDDHFLIAYWNSNKNQDQLYIASPSESNSLSDKTIIMAGISTPQGILDAISDFNRGNELVKIQFVDYSEEYSYEEATTRLNLDIISGDAPDIILLNGLNYEMYASKGILCDLYTLIDNDESLSRESFLEQPLNVLDKNGHLYQLADSFSIATQITLINSVENKASLTLTELIDTYKSSNQRLFLQQDKQSVLFDLLFQSMEEYVDFDSGTCCFDSNEFICLLDFINSLDDSPDPEYNNGSEISALLDGKIMLMNALLTGFDSIQNYEEIFDGKAVYIGYPSTTDCGSAFYLNNMIAISDASLQKDASWEFIKSFLSGNSYNSRGGWSLLKSNYDSSKTNAINSGISPSTINIADKLINSITHSTIYDAEILSIVQEETASFFSGDKNASDVATIIQNRVGIYLSEQQ